MIYSSPLKLIFPPQFEPFQPYLSLPYLKGLLKKYNVESKCFDANIDFYLWLFKEWNKAQTLGSSRKKYLISNVDAAIKILMSVPCSLETYRWAINIADEYLSAISPIGTRINLNSFSMGNKYSSADLLNFINKKDNIFKRYFEYAQERILEKADSQMYLFSLVVLDQLGASLSFAQKIKKCYPNAKIVFGGPFISRFYERLRDIPWLSKMVDVLAPGEAYKALPKLLDKKKLWLGHVRPDFSDFNLKNYLSPHPVLPYLVTHGCNWGKCIFCTHHLSYSEYRATNLKDVISDITALSKEHSIKYISFCDEYLTSSQLKDFIDLSRQEKIDIKWSSFVKAEPVFCDQDFTKKLYDSGARLLMFGFESASQRVLTAMKKGTNVSHYVPILKSCKESHIAVRLDFMLGFPSETSRDIQKTFSFIKRYSDYIDTPFSSYATAVFELREDTPIMNEMKKYKIRINGRLRGDLDEQYDFVNYSGVSSKLKYVWRQKVIRFAKTNLNFELITPQNKTHQLIYKDLYDQKTLQLPVTKIIVRDFHRLFAKLNAGIKTLHEKNSGFVRVINYSSGGELEISVCLVDLLRGFKKGIDLHSAYLLGKDNGLNLIRYIKLINFLCRNDYIIIKNV